MLWNNGRSQKERVGGSIQMSKGLVRGEYISRVRYRTWQLTAGASAAAVRHQGAAARGFADFYPGPYDLTCSAKG